MVRSIWPKNKLTFSDEIFDGGFNRRSHCSIPCFVAVQPATQAYVFVIYVVRTAADRF
jgi:hypothetical protein